MMKHAMEEFHRNVALEGKGTAAVHRSALPSTHLNNDAWDDRGPGLEDALGGEKPLGDRPNAAVARRRY